MAKRPPTHDFHPFAWARGLVRTSIAPPTGAFHLGIRKLTAAGLALSLGMFPCAPLAVGQTSPTAVTKTVTPPQPRSLPGPSAKQSVKARAKFRKGTEALRAGKSGRAIKLFAAAHLLDPGNGAYLAAYEIARQQQIGDLVETAKTDQRQGQTAQARKQLELADNLDPDNPFVEEHIRSLASEQEPEVVRSTPMPEFSSGLVELEPTDARATFHLRGNAQQIVKQIFLAYGVTALIDDSVMTKEVRIDLTNASFAEASTAIQLSTDTFIVPLDARHALVAKDTRENRTKFQRLLLETVFLPGLSKKQMAEPVKLIRTVFGVKQVSDHPATGAVSIRAPEATLRAVNATLARLYLDKPEVVLDIRVYQLNDSRQQDLGVSFPQSLDVFNVSSQLSSIIASNQSTVSELIASGLVNPGDLAGIAALLVGLGLVNGTVLNQPFALFGNGLTLSGLSFGSASANASLNVSNTRELDHVQLRGSDMEKQSFLVGSRYPVVTQSYSSGTQLPTSSTSLEGLLAGSNQATTGTVNPLSYAPSVQYQDLGLTVKAQPQVMASNDVQVKLQVKIASLGGGTVNGNPIINNRSFTTSVQIPDGGSALIASSISETESRALSGIPGLSELPGFAWTASPKTQRMIGKLLIVISPEIVSATPNRSFTRMLPLPPHSGTR